MGACASATAIGCCRPKYRRSEDAAAPLGDISALDLDTLLRRGIAEAQRATVARQSQKDRLRHIRSARRVLREALQRCGRDDPDLFVHLSAVLLKLGEDPGELRGLLIDFGPAGAGGSREPASATSSAGAAGPSPQASGSRSPSVGSSTEGSADAAPHWENDELGGGLLDVSEEDEPPSATTCCLTSTLSQSPSTEPVAAESPTVPVAAAAPEVLVDSSARLRSVPLSTVQESDEAACSGGDSVSSKPPKAAGSPQLTPPTASLAPGPADARGLPAAAPSAQPPHAEPQEPSDDQAAGSERAPAADAAPDESEASSLSPARSPLYPRSSPTCSRDQEDAAGGEWPESAISNPVEQLLVGEDKERIGDVQDAVSSLRALTEKRRHANMSGRHAAGSDSDGSAARRGGCLAFAGSKPQTPGLENASPSLEAGVRNPLSQAELLFAATVLGKGSASSPCAQSQASDTFSIAGSGAPSSAPSAAPSAAPSPFSHAAAPIMEVAPPPNGSASDVVCVKILNGVSGEEEVRFFVPIEESFSEQHFLSILDRLCKQHTGHPLSGLNWLNPNLSGDRYQRRKCDVHMVEEVLSGEGTSKRRDATVLLLCTVPVKPPSELEICRVRLRSVAPPRIAGGTEMQVRLKLETSLLEASQAYSVAFTHQVSMLTHMAEATLLKSLRGVELVVPLEMLAASSQRTTDGLYDVYLIINNTFRSENRRTLTVGSAESELSSSSAGHMTSGSFVPIIKGRQLAR